jgi:DNA (cytosine-5)-methyltransferase 1
MFTSIDLFSGPGGICTGFKWANIKPLIAVEWSDWTVETYSKTHNADVLHLEKFLNNELENSNELFNPSEKTLLIHGDITKVSNDLIDRILRERFNRTSVDIVTGGAPCESFSMAGQRKEDDERNDLFLNILRVARHVKSKMVLFENVKGLLSKKLNGKKGLMFEAVCDEFNRVDNETGTSFTLASHNPDEVLLLSSDFGVPQNRERIFLVGINNQYQATFHYPEPTHGKDREYPYVTVADALFDLPQIESNEEEIVYEFNIDSVEEEHIFKYLSIMRGELLQAPEHIQFDEHTLNNHKTLNHRESMIERFRHIYQGESQKTAAERLIASGQEHIRENFFPKKLYGARCRRLDETKPSFTVTSHCLDEMIHPRLHRQLSPLEAARLQSFPDWYQFQGPYVKFHSHPEQDRYEQIGDAIPPILAYHLGMKVAVTLQQIYVQQDSLKQEEIIV